MEKAPVFIGLKLNFCEDGTAWRIIYLDSRICILVMMNTSSRCIKQVVTNELIREIYENKIFPDYEESQIVVDLKRVPLAELEKFNQKLAFVREVHSIYGPTYLGLTGNKPKTELVDIYRKYKYERHKAYRYLLAWLQSGFNDYSLLNKNLVNGTKYTRTYKGKPGPISGKGILVTEEVKAHFDHAVEAYKKNRVMHIVDAYELLLYRFYSKVEDDQIVLLPPEERPTEKQFRYYLGKQLSAVDVEKKKTSSREYENNSRLFLKSPSIHDMGPGSILEVDAMEMDFNVVSVFNNQKNIGRPILYMLTDRYSHCIVGFHVGFDNNSMLGLTNAILNLFDDRAYILRSHGIRNFDLKCWPSPFIPNEFWCDRGSDFASDKFSRICHELNVVRTLEEPAQGSMKGLIERSFGIFNTLVLPLLVGKGLIEKRYDSTHKRDACLTIEEAYQIAASFVAYRNSTPMKNYKPSTGMMKACIDLSPISIWNYGCELLGPPRPITPNNQMLNIYKLLVPATGTITREGVTFKGLVYCNGVDDHLIKLMSLSKSNMNKRDLNGRRMNAFDFRLDPRSINEIFYELDGKIRIIKLADGRNGDYTDMTWDEYQDCIDNLKNIKKLAAEKVLRNRIAARAALADIVNNAVTGIHSDSKHLLIHRELDQNESNFNNRVVQHINESSINSNTKDSKVMEEPISLDNNKLSQSKDDKDEQSLFDEECPEELLNWRK